MSKEVKNLSLKEAVQVNESRFVQDLKVPLIINGNKSCRGWYNLVVSIRDVSLYSKGIKPHRNWRITDVKKYFGISGNPETVLSKLEFIKSSLV